MRNYYKRRNYKTSCNKKTGRILANAGYDAEALSLVHPFGSCFLHLLLTTALCKEGFPQLCTLLGPYSGGNLKVMIVQRLRGELDGTLDSTTPWLWRAIYQPFDTRMHHRANAHATGL